MFRYRFFITVFPHVIALIYFNHHLIIECNHRAGQHIHVHDVETGLWYPSFKYSDLIITRVRSKCCPH